MKHAALLLGVALTLVLSVPADLGAQWVRVGEPSDYDHTSAFVGDGHRLFAIAGSRLYCSSDAGNGWDVVPTTFPVKSIALVGAKIFADGFGTYNGYYYEHICVSTDSGRTWADGFTVGADGWTAVYNIYTYDTTKFLITGEMIGVSWCDGRGRYSGLGEYKTGSVLISGKYAVALWPPAYLSGDGMTWKAIPDPSSGLWKYWVSAFASTQWNGTPRSTLFASDKNDSSLYRSTDEGTTWQKLPASPVMQGSPVVQLAAAQATLFGRTANGKLYFSTDQGASWDTTGEGFSSDNIFVNGGNVFSYSPAFGLRRRPLRDFSPEMTLAPSLSALDVSGTAGRTFFRTTNSGTGALHWQTASDVSWLRANSDRQDTIEIAYDVNPTNSPRTGTLTISSNAWNSPQTVTVRQGSAPPVMHLSASNFSVSDDSGVVFVRVTNTGAGTLSWQTTEGQDWTHTDSNLEDTIRIFYDENRLSTERTGTVTIVSNASNSPQQVTIRQAARLFPKAVMLLKPENNAALRADSVTFQWQCLPSPVYHYWLEVSLDSTFTRNYITLALADTSSRWPLPARDSAYFWHVRGGNQYGWGALSEMRRFTVSPVSAVAQQGLIPTETQLQQNFPNPFNPTTTIRYGLPSISHVKLTVYSTLGEEVALLVDDVQQSGYHSVQFNATSLASGMYFYRLQTGSYTETRKLVLMR